MKKLALLASAALIGAAVADAPAASATGFYTGVNLGMANTQDQHTYSDANTIETQYSGKLSGRGMQYGLFGGYNVGLGGGTVVGVELSLGGDNSKIDRNEGQSKTNVKRTMYYGLAPRIGYMITPNVLAYVRLGLEGGSWKGQQTWGADGTVAATGTPNVSRKKNRINFAPGFGFDIFASKSVFVRAQFHHLFGPKVDLGQTVSGTDGVIKNTHKISQQVFTLGFGYKF